MPTVTLVMGVCGTGKTSLGCALADALLDATFVEGDTFHSDANREKMRRGEALTDEDRWGWLRALRAHIDDLLGVEGNSADAKHIVLACSALKEAYRAVLLEGLPCATCIVHLTCPQDVLLARLQQRLEAGAHFMPPALVQSQFDALQAPKDAVVLDTSVLDAAGCLAEALRGVAK